MVYCYKYHNDFKKYYTQILYIPLFYYVNNFTIPLKHFLRNANNTKSKFFRTCSILAI